MTTLLGSSEPDAGEGHDAAPVAGVPARLEALAELVELGQDRVANSTLNDAYAVLGKAGARLQLPGDHTVVALAGATGSGKSSLFNALADIDFSTVGVRRPTTGSAHACVWGLEGSRQLLEWLSIEKRHRYARASALDSEPDTGSRRSQRGLVLLDLPDHDSTEERHRREVDRLVSVADLIVWVVDPQKYADAAVHERYLRPSVGYQSVTAVVLNQIDVLSPEEADECVADLRELLASSGLSATRVLATSMRTGTGLDELRGLIDETLTQRRAATDRLGADLDRIAARLSPDAGEAGNADEIAIHPGRRSTVVARLEEAAGVSAAARAAEREHWQCGVRHVEWLYARVARRVRGDPFHRVRLGQEARAELHGGAPSTPSAQPAMVYNALRDAAEVLTAEPPQPWLRAIRHAGRARAEEAPDALGEELTRAAGAVGRPPLWWRVTEAVQVALALCALLGLGWVGCIIAFGYAEVAGSAVPWLLRDTGLLPYAASVSVGTLAAGVLTEWLGRRALMREALARRHASQELLAGRVDAVAEELVFAPMQQEIERYARFCRKLSAAAGQGSRGAQPD